ncbi:very-long-chain enoyl-CoA reductase-like isoform X3 [Dromiciops gliroides]|uniref:very-long-chain enoyl-CoA reductase-like isoform X3 n=1 Tax=Dromiciops gliroides TaxID=33562 RepID=UPI001CC66E56|nr:very-long-chain enoyl-CoA reductase-like isoform X3 [Dromiciops gliroides]
MREASEDRALVATDRHLCRQQPAGAGAQSALGSSLTLLRFAWEKEGGRKGERGGGLLRDSPFPSLHRCTKVSPTAFQDCAGQPRREQQPLDANVEILDYKTKKQLCFLDKVEPHASINDIRLMFHKFYPQWYPARQSMRLDPKGKALRNEEILQRLPVGTTATLYFKDLGPQIGWTMVFLIEYAGSLFIYLLFYLRMPFVYGLEKKLMSRRLPVVNLACICHSSHYIKRLIETIFVHRFSHGTMPLKSIFKNCFFYWGFAAWLAYYINHPLYTPPSYGQKQINFSLITFLLCEAGNFSIHVELNNLRGNGPKTRRIPYPTKNPFTWLFFFVSCPNYTYED